MEHDQEDGNELEPETDNDAPARAIATATYNGILALAGMLHTLGHLRASHIGLLHAAMSRPLDDPAVRDDGEIALLRGNLDQLLSSLASKRGGD
jgi:hypothetical protein